MAFKAYDELDERYPRCDATEVRRIFTPLKKAFDHGAVFVSESGYMAYYEIPEKISDQIAMWKLDKGLYMVITMSSDENNGCRRYMFWRVDPESGEFAGCVNFLELPSAAVGSAFLEEDAESLNNHAVLRYGGIADFEAYPEECVIRLLERSAREGCATAKYNLGVLYENRGENKEAARYYEESRAMMRNTR